VRHAHRQARSGVKRKRMHGPPSAPQAGVQWPMELDPARHSPGQPHGTRVAQPGDRPGGGVSATGTPASEKRLPREHDRRHILTVEKHGTVGTSRARPRDMPPRRVTGARCARPLSERVRGHRPRGQHAVPAASSHGSFAEGSRAAARGVEEPQPLHAVGRSAFLCRRHNRVPLTSPGVEPREGRP